MSVISLPVSVLDHFVHAVYLRVDPDPHYQGLPASFSPWKFVLVDLLLTDGDLFGLAPSLPQGHPQLDPEPGLLLVRIMCPHVSDERDNLGVLYKYHILHFCLVFSMMIFSVESYLTLTREYLTTNIACIFA